MRKWFQWAAVLSQLAVIAAMAWPREWALRTGQPTWIRTAPLDPRDPFRGDFARLHYDISEVPLGSCSESLLKALGLRTQRQEALRVFAVLQVDESGVAKVQALLDREPEGGLYLRGRATGAWSEHAMVEYGLEAFFTEQGQALALERRPEGLPEKARLEMEVMIGSGGVGVIRSHRWSP
jgi:uncharacterized membrane-anchored protein